MNERRRRRRRREGRKGNEKEGQLGWEKTDTLRAPHAEGSMHSTMNVLPGCPLLIAWSDRSDHTLSEYTLSTIADLAALFYSLITPQPPQSSVITITRSLWWLDPILPPSSHCHPHPTPGVPPHSHTLTQHTLSISPSWVGWGVRWLSRDCTPSRLLSSSYDRGLWA